ncbi:MAG: hypothetical protein NZ602_15570 [Thermoguttaceae bacterium]|nr:hypothetical protein [Thermoguttaceae bacterium]MDW8037581.1 hypothetical protein [Thermoguttaceae bacterium]
MREWLKIASGFRCFLVLGLAGWFRAETVAAPDQSLPLSSSPKYAWPRQDQMLLDGLWQVAWTDRRATSSRSGSAQSQEKSPKQASGPSPASGADLQSTDTQKPSLPENLPVSLPENFDQLDWFEVRVPTEVHWALYRAGKAGHPYVGLHATKMRWVEEKMWWFRRRFVVPEEFRAPQVRLVFDGVDYYAHYWLNGHYLGRSEGAFGGVSLPVGQLLRYGQENDLVVRLECGGYQAGRPGGAASASLVKSELWSGWPIGARDFNTIGIWRSVRLVRNGWPCLERPFVRTVHLADKEAKLRVSVEVCTVEEKEPACDLAVTIRGRGFQSPPVEGRLTALQPKPSTVVAELDLRVPEPRLWWPNGLGDQPMYEAEIRLEREGRLLDRLVVPFGIRTIERCRAGRPWESYRTGPWVFRINGQEFFVKGTNWMPIDALADLNAEDYHWHLQMARDAGIQMIRVWGGGILEPEIFYQLCDQWGMLVWQDFPLSCGWQAKALPRQIWENTVIWNICRLRNHPSLAFWCGGNEFDPYHPANADLILMLRRYVELLDGTRPFMGASPEEDDIHAYPQWEASWAWRSELVQGPFISEWGSHAMPSAATYRQIVRPEEAEAVIGPSLLQMDKKLMQDRFPEITYHWVEFQPDRLPQMLARGSAFDNLAEAPLGRFSEAVAAGSGEFYKMSAEAARAAFPQNGGLLFWVWKRPWPIVGIQICDGFGHPLAVYYDLKRAFRSPWVCLAPPHLTYIPGEEVEMPIWILSEACRPVLKGVRVKARLIGPDLTVRQEWKEWPAVDLPGSSRPIQGPCIRFQVPQDAKRAFFFMVLELEDAAGRLLARNVYPFRCPPQLEDEHFRKQYRAKPSQAFVLTEGPWLRVQLEKLPTKLALHVLRAEKEDFDRLRLEVEVENKGARPAVMTTVQPTDLTPVVAEDGYFWLEPGESRRLWIRLRLAPAGPVPDPGATRQGPLALRATAWNAPDTPAVLIPTGNP